MVNQTNKTDGCNILLGNEDGIDITNDEILTTHQDQDEEPNEDGDHGIKFKDWGFKIDRLFEVAYRFYKKHEGKAFHPSFDERNQMNALILQARYGNFDSGGKTPDVGALDLVGKNRRYQWSLLKGMSKAEAMSNFVCTLDRICPLFKAHAEAVKINSGLQTNQASQSESMQGNAQGGTSRSESDEQLNTIHKSLCRQTFNQFKSYAEKQFPNDPTKQKTMIVTLQEQYYQQYIAQMQSSNYSNNHQSSTNNGTSKQSSTTTPEPSQDLKSVPQVLQNGVVISPTTTEDMNSVVTKHQLMDEREVINAAFDATKDPFPESSNGCNLTQLDSIASAQSLTEQHHQYTQEKSQQHSSNIEKLNNYSNGNCDKHIPQNYSDHQQTTPSQLETIPEHSLAEKDNQPVKSVTPKLNTQGYNGQVIAVEACCEQGVSPQRIGTFESYPEPKIIQKSISEQPDLSATTYTNLFNYGQEQPQATSLYTNTCSSNLSPQPIQAQQAQELQYYQQQQFQPPDQSQEPSIQDTSAYHHNGQPLAQYPVAVAHPLADCPQQQAIDPWSCRSSTSDGNSSPLQQSISYEPIEAATIWTKKGVNEFKDSLIDDKHGGAYVVKQGTLLTIQVPTYPDGKYIHWEFATDDFDIAFGLDFINELNLVEPLALKISEEIDEDEDEVDGNEIDGLAFDDLNHDVESALESGELDGTNRRNALERKRAEKFARMANTISIVPTYRRDSHEEVFVGRHRYPGKGYYLLKFDNTYSVLRSKSLFFRICYFI